jgi:transposase
MDVKVLNRQGMSVRQIARTMGLSRVTVRKILCQAAPKSYGPRRKRPGKLTAYEGYLLGQLEARPWVRSTQLFEEVRSLGYAGHYEAVKVFVRRQRQEARALRRACARFETGPAEEAQFDWKGPLKGLVQAEPERALLVFRLVLGYSRLRVSRVALTQQLPEALMDLAACFGRLGGVPHRIVLDNFKAAVLRPRPGLELQPFFSDFCRAYGCEPAPALPYSPQRKGKVERSFGDFVDGDLLHRTYSSMEELQSALDEDDRRHAERMHSETGQTPAARFEKERDFLLALPPVCFDPRLPEPRRVLSDCTISWAAARYSVPHRFVGKAVIVKADPKGRGIEVFHKDELAASHPLVPKGERRILPEHVAELQRARWDRLRQRKSRRAPRTAPALVSWAAPEVLLRPIEVYAEVAGGVR